MEGIEMPLWLSKALGESGFTEAQIEALRLAMRNSWVDHYAKSYAHGMMRAYQEFGIEGIKTNITYLLMNLGHWKGPEARAVKKILRAIK
jgi:pyruvate carboxylase